jgi:two-component system response regulator PilR (NtrC family)
LSDIQHILLVDDDDDILDVFESMVATLPNVRIVRAQSGAEAIRTLEEQAFSCVVTDLKMPDGNGLKVRDFAAQQGIGTIIVTGFAAAYNSALGTGDIVLQKPLAKKILLDAISAVLSRSKVSA